MSAACTGSDAVIAQAWETAAWLLSPPVIGTVALALGFGLWWFFWFAGFECLDRRAASRRVERHGGPS